MPSLHRNALLAVFAVAPALLIAAPASAAPNPAAAPTEVVSPLPGTPDANPHTQISFLGAPASDLRDIAVVGSVSGRHAGHLAFYSTHTGGSFLPSQPFVAGEHVNVTARVVGFGKAIRVRTSFTVDDPYTLPMPKPVKPIALTDSNVLRFHSRPHLEPASISVTTPAADPSLGDVFMTSDAGPGQAGTMIISPGGQLVWFRPLPGQIKAFDLNLQTYAGQPVLTWWQGHVVDGHGQGVDEIYNTSYQHVATIHAGNGLHADLHDFDLTAQGTAWITAYAPQHYDLSRLGGLADGLLEDGAVQEIDIKTGLVMFEWHALGHVEVSDTYSGIPHYPGELLDYFHLNSLEPLPDGTLLISSRDTWATYLVSLTTGGVIWRLGGKKSSFTLGPGVQFAWQHDARIQPDGSLTLFNNDDYPKEGAQSSALVISLDPTAHTATLVQSFTHPTPILSASQGDLQPLPNGDSFVGWGHIADASEFSPTGQLTFDLHLASPTNSYRAFRFPWSGQPRTRPAIVASAAGSGTQIYASWDGATDVTSWQVLAGSSPSALSAVGTYPDAGFETAILAPTSAAYVAVQALSSTGAVLSSSKAIAPAG